MSMQIASNHMKQHFYAFRIGRVVDDLMKCEDVFREQLDRAIVIQQLTDQMKMLPVEKFLTIEHHVFRQQVGSFMATQLMEDMREAYEPISK